MTNRNEFREKDMAKAALLYVQAQAEIVVLEARVAELEAERDRMRETLNQLANPCGRFSRDPLERAHNCIEDMIAVARAALSKPQ